MTVKNLLGVCPELCRISFVYENSIDGRVVEKIDCSAPGSYYAVRRHEDEKVISFFAVAENEIQIEVE